MFKLIPARGPLHTFKDGDVIEIRRGHNTIGQIVLAASPRGTSVTFYDAEGERRFTSERTAAITTENIRDIWWHTTYGTALYLKVEGTPAKEEEVPENDFGNFIVWCPASERPPRVVLHSRAQAKAVAISMSERHNGTFHWCEIKGTAEQVTTRTTKITD